MSNRIKGIFTIIVATILYGFEWILIKELDKIGLNSFAITFGMVVFALFGLIFLARINKINLISGAKNDWKNLIWLGLFFSFNAVLFFAALAKGLVASVVLLNYLAPIWTMLAAKVFLGERLTKIKLFSLFIAITGLMLVVDVFALKSVQWTSSLMIGNMLALAGSFFYAGRNIISKKTVHLSEYMRSFWMFLVASVVLFFANFLFPPEFPLESLPLILFYLLLLGIGIQMISMLLIQFAFKYLEASKVSTFLLLEIITASLTAWLIAGQTPSVIVVCGGGLIILACIALITEK